MRSPCWTLLAGALVVGAACIPDSPEGLPGELTLVLGEQRSTLAIDAGVLGGRVGASQTLQLSGENTGRGRLLVRTVRLDASEAGTVEWFIRGGEGQALQAGGTATWTVTFSPTTAGTRSARLTFEHDGLPPAPVVHLSATVAP